MLRRLIMRPNELLTLLNQRPFEPMRLHISSGETVDIRHPEMAIVGRSLVFVAVAERGKPAKPGQMVDHVAHYNLLHIVKIEPLNGARPKRQKSKRRKSQ